MAGQTGQANNSIILNASGTTLSVATQNSFCVKPVRSRTNGTTNPLYYDNISGEIYYIPSV